MLTVTRSITFMRFSPKARLAAYLAGIAAAVGVIVWTEMYSWQRVDEIRTSGRPISLDDVRSIHQMLTWSSVALLAVGAVLSVLIYKGAIAPLRERLEQSKRVIERQEKLSSLGVLAAGVAHEVRNPLTSIKVRLFTQQRLLKQGTEAFDDNVFITEEITRLEEIVRDFLAFARPTDPEFKVLRATQPLRELEGFFRPTLSAQRIGLKDEFLADPQINVDPQQLKQILINLIQNAAEAVRQDGTITLRTSTSVPRRGERGEALAVLEVEDTGPGIAPEVQPRIFDPFFTTKASGTGLGLSMAARILEKHRGRLEFQTQPGQGTVFRILLPIAHTEAQPVESVKPTSAGDEPLRATTGP